MRLVVQRVLESSVQVNNQLISEISKGLLILIGIEEADSELDADWLIQKVSNLRIFSDEAGKMNLSLIDIQGSVLVVSQFTLHASTKKGNRPSFIKAAKPEHAIPLYEYFVEKLKTDTGLNTQTGIFGADMKISLVNDGPVTLVIDSKSKE